MAEYYGFQGIDQTFWVQQLQQRQQFDVHPTKESYEPFQQAYPREGFLEHPQMQYDLHSQPYNFGWHEHYDPHSYQYNSECYEESNMNFSYQVDQPYYQPPNQALLAPEPEPSFEELIKVMQQTIQQQNQAIQQQTQALQQQIGQLASSISELQVQEASNLPSQPNQNEEDASLMVCKNEENEIEGEEIEVVNEVEINNQASSQVSAKISQEELEDSNFLPPPFPNKLVEFKREEHKKISVGENTSIVIQRKFPYTCKNPDFYILEIPLLKIAKSEIDVHDGILSMEVDGVTLIFNIFKAMKYPADDDSILSIDVVDFSMQDVFDLDSKDELSVKLEVQLSKKSWMQIEEPEEKHLEHAKIIVVQPLILILENLKKIFELYIPPSPITWLPPRLIFDPG